MANVFSILIILTSLFIFFEDFTSREVTWFFFPLLCLFGIFRSAELSGFMNSLQQAAISLVAVILQFLVLLCFYVLRDRSFAVLQKIGPGDFLFMAACCFVLPLRWFLLFNIASLVLTLPLHFLYLKNSNYTKKGTTVSMAGWQALMLSILIMLDMANLVNTL